MGAGFASHLFGGKFLLVALRKRMELWVCLVLRSSRWNIRIYDIISYRINSHAIAGRWLTLIKNREFASRRENLFFPFFHFYRNPTGSCGNSVEMILWIHWYLGNPKLSFSGWNVMTRLSRQPFSTKLSFSLTHTSCESVHDRCTLCTVWIWLI